jgi:hypothetical protein
MFRTIIAFVCGLLALCSTSFAATATVMMRVAPGPAYTGLASSVLVTVYDNTHTALATASNTPDGVHSFAEEGSTGSYWALFNVDTTKLPLSYTTTITGQTLTFAPVSVGVDRAIQIADGWTSTRAAALDTTGTNAATAATQATNAATSSTANGTALTTLQTTATAIKTKTDQLSFTGGNANAAVQNLPSEYLSSAEQGQLSTAATQASNAATSSTANGAALTTLQTATAAIKAQTDLLSFLNGNVLADIRAYGTGKDPVSMFKADSAGAKLFNRSKGKFTYNTTSHILTLIGDDGTTLDSVTLTVDADGNITSRS